MTTLIIWIQRTKMIAIFAACFLLFSCSRTDSGIEVYPFQNQAKPIDERVNDLVARLTLDEKISMLDATFEGVPRLGIPKYYYGNEALHGVVRPGKFTVFPQAIAFAATWNDDLVHNIATAISDEARGRWNELRQGRDQKKHFSDLLVFWSPTINLARDPRWGRTAETYGEDPLLTSKIATAFVRGLQGNHPKYIKVIATPKHYTANNEEHNRFECNAVMTERSLREYYLAPFEAVVKEGNAQSIMSAYNAINGVPCTANSMLINDILRKEWNFDGYVVSDCGAPDYIYSGHKFVTSQIDAAVAAINAGVDLECGGNTPQTHIFKNNLSKAYDLGKLKTAQIDTAVGRVLMARFKLGIFDSESSVPFNKIPSSVIGSKPHQ